MFGKLILWLCSVVFAFSLGARAADPKVSDSELQQRIRDHMDVIVDEAAGMADDIAEEIRNDERVQQASEFVDDVREIVQNTKDDIQDHFGTPSEEGAVEGELEGDTEAPEENSDADASATPSPVVDAPAEEAPADTSRSDG